MTHDELIAVIAAHRDGRDIQWLRDYDKKWMDMETCNIGRFLWELASTPCRVKPQPRRGFVADVFVHQDRETVRRYFPQAEIIEFVEVVE
jgi:hypothetical protein